MLVGGIAIALINTGILLLSALFSWLSYIGGEGGVIPPVSAKIVYALVILTSIAGVVLGWVWVFYKDLPWYWKALILVPYILAFLLIQFPNVIYL
jgi:hypothetical protein